MGSINEDQLRNAFAKLRDYSPEIDGVSWTAIETTLTRTSAWSATRKVVIATSVLILLVISPFAIQHREERSGQPNKQLNLESKATEQQLTVGSPAEVRIEKALSVFNSEQQVPTSEVEESFPARDKNEHGEYLLEVTSLSLVKAAVSQMRINVLNESTMEDTEHSKTNMISFSVAPTYVFGFAQPKGFDNVTLSDYEFKPGFGLQADFMFQISTNNRRMISIGPSFMFINKRFSYSSFEYEPESVTSTEHATVSRSLYVGVGVDIESRRSQFHFKPSLYRSVAAGGLSSYSGRTLISASVYKQFKPLGGSRYSFTAGANISAPLSSVVADFKYYPAQLFFGIRRN